MDYIHLHNILFTVSTVVAVRLNLGLGTRYTILINIATKQT